MTPDLYYKYQELVDVIVLTNLLASVVILNNELYYKKINTDNYYKFNNDRIFQELNFIIDNIEDENFYYNLMTGKIIPPGGPGILQYKDIYFAYNIKKLKQENKILINKLNINL
jgi:hypothetical protein